MNAPATKLTPEQARAILESLFALPDKAPKAKKPTQPSAKQATAKPTAPAEPVPIQRNKAFRPTVAIVEVVQQRCTTCGSIHKHVRSRRIRFESIRPGELHTAIEAETIVPENLPRRIDFITEDTNVCPTCLKAGEYIEEYIATAPGEQPVQLELFHG